MPDLEIRAAVSRDTVQVTRFMWLEITGQCQLACEHCYALSGPDGTHGDMTVADWVRVINEAADVGVSMMQFIGGEPTLHPNLGTFVRQALQRNIGVEIFTNLSHVSLETWELFSLPGVRLATSYYSDVADEHDSITRGKGSYRRTTAQIAEAVRRSIPLRVGIIGVREGQRHEAAKEHLAALGVSDIGLDFLREVGRGVRGAVADESQLCGNCANGVLAVSPSGDVWPCVFSRWLPVGNVRTQPLEEIVGGATFAKTRTDLRSRFEVRASDDCGPNNCHPHCWPMCQPNCGPACSPACIPMGNCNPSYGR